MNSTHAQRLATDRVLDLLNPADMTRSFLVLAVVLVVAAGWSGLCSARIGSAILPRSRREIAVTVALGVLACGLAAWCGRVLLTEHSILQSKLGQFHLAWMAAAAVAGLRHAWRRVDCPLLMAALAAGLLPVLRGKPWDYYYVESFLFGFATFQQLRQRDAWDAVSAEVSDSRRLTASGIPGWLIPVVGVLLAMGLLDFLRIKVRWDRNAAVVRLHEEALRRGALKPVELAMSTFGHRAWHLYEYYTQHEGRTSDRVSGFDRYVVRSNTVVRVEFPRGRKLLSRLVTTSNLAPTEYADAARERLHEIEAPMLWFWRVRYQLDRWQPLETAVLRQAVDWTPVRESELSSHPYPLTDSEWSDLGQRWRGAAATSGGSRRD